MPGPIYVPGARNTSVPPPPKPVTKPQTTPAAPSSGPLARIPSEPIQAWRGLWHVRGSNLPWYINHSRKTRRAMSAFAKTHG
jgi:hypothetical protein